MNDKKMLRNLDSEITLAKANKHDKKIKKRMLKSFKKILVLAGLPSIGFATFLFLPANAALIITLVLSFGAVGTYLVSDLKKYYFLSKKRTNVISIKTDENKDEEDLLDDLIIDLKDGNSKYYTQNYMEEIAKRESELVNEELLKDSNVKDNDIIYSKVESKAKLTQDIDLYYYAYKLPAWNITEEEWDYFFDSLYDLFIQKNIEHQFYNRVSFLVRYTLSSAMVLEKGMLGITGFINNLDILVDKNISLKEILQLKKELLKLANKDKIVKMNQ